MDLFGAENKKEKRGNKQSNYPLMHLSMSTMHTDLFHQCTVAKINIGFEGERDHEGAQECEHPELVFGVGVVARVGTDYIFDACAHL
jgi:hypothetical protein